MITLQRFTHHHSSRMKGVVFLICFVFAGFDLLAQTQSGIKAVLSELTDNSDPSKGSVTIRQDPRIEELMEKRKDIQPPASNRSSTIGSFTTNVRSGTGYRVQGILQQCSTSSERSSLRGPIQNQKQISTTSRLRFLYLSLLESSYRRLPNHGRGSATPCQRKKSLPRVPTGNIRRS